MRKGKGELSILCEIRTLIGESQVKIGQALRFAL